MAGENRGGAQPPKDSSTWKKIAMGLGLMGALGGAVESGRLNVKSAGATSESKSSADEEEGEGDGEEKKAEAPKNVSGSGNLGVENNLAKSNPAEDKKIEVDNTFETLDNLNEFFSNNPAANTFSFEAKESIDANLHCIVKHKQEKGVPSKASKMEIIINKDGTFTIKSVSDYDEPTTVNSLQDLADNLVHRDTFEDSAMSYDSGNPGSTSADTLADLASDLGIKLAKKPGVPSVNRGETITGTPENQEELKRKAAEMLPRGDELKN